MPTRADTGAPTTQRRTIDDRRTTALRILALVFALVCGLAVLIVTALSAAQAQTASRYAFTKVADSAEDNLDAGSFECSSINDRGDVAFRAGRRSANGFNTVDGVYRANADGGLTTVAQNARRFDFIGRNPSMNDQGWVSFAANLDSGNEVILRDNGREERTIANTAGRYEFFTADTSINNSNVVAFKSDLDEEFGFDEGLFSGRNQQVATRYLASTSKFGGSESRPSINDLGNVAFEERTDSGRQGIFITREDGFFRTIALADPEGFVDEPVLNDAGTVVFENNFTDESGAFVSEIVAKRGGSLTTIADTRARFGSFGFRPPSLNNDGDVAFLATLDDFETDGIYVVGPGGDRRQVISTDDTLDGRTIQNLTFCEEGLSDTDNLTFVARLEDPDSQDGFRAAVFRAMPTR